MFKKTKVREILTLLNQNLSTREIERALSVSKNTVAFIKKEYDKCDKEWEDIESMNDDEIYALFYPHKFTPRNRFAPVDYSYVHKELPKKGVTLTLLWEEYCEECKRNGAKSCCYVTYTTGYRKYLASKNFTSRVERKPGITIEVDWAGSTMKYTDPDTGDDVSAYLFVATLPYSQYTYVEARNSVKQIDWLECNLHMLEYIEGVPIRIVCDNLKTGVISHPKHGEIVLNDSYLAFGEHYQIAIIPAAVKKPKHKASVEGSVDKIADKIIGMLRNEKFNSLDGLNIAIKKKLEELNNKPFQKREGSRRIIFEVEEKPTLRPLPLLPFEVCEWSYKHKVHPDSHIWFKKGKYSVPSNLIGELVDIKYGSENIYIYHLGRVVATHKLIPKGYKNVCRTDPSHLPYPLYTPETIESIKIKASEIGKNTMTVVERLIENVSFPEQAINDIKPVLGIAKAYNDEVLEKACKKALKDFYIVTYNTLIKYAKEVNKQENIKKQNKSQDKNTSGIIRGPEYYGGL